MHYFFREKYARDSNRLNSHTAAPTHPCTAFQQEEVIVMFVTLDNTELDWNFWHFSHKLLKLRKVNIGWMRPETFMN